MHGLYPKMYSLLAHTKNADATSLKCQIEHNFIIKELTKITNWSMKWNIFYCTHAWHLGTCTLTCTCIQNSNNKAI